MDYAELVKTQQAEASQVHRKICHRHPMTVPHKKRALWSVAKA